MAENELTPSGGGLGVGSIAGSGNIGPVSTDVQSHVEGPFAPEQHVAESAVEAAHNLEAAAVAAPAGASNTIMVQILVGLVVAGVIYVLTRKQSG